jgi:DNA-binding IclR family transcriptional regulator
MDDEGGSGKQVIARAAAVLRVLADTSTGLSIGQIAKATGLPRTTAHRIVAALEAQQLAVSGVGGTRLGSALVRMAASASKDIAELARPSVELLGRRTRETVDVCVHRGLHAVSISQFPSDQELRVVCHVGTAFPVHASAHGKALLADMAEEELDSLFHDRLEQRTRLTVKNLEDLRQQIQAVRELGYAVDLEEHAVGVCGLGVFIRTGLPERHAISLAVPSVRFHEKRESFVAALLQCKAEIEAITSPRA